MHNQPMVEQPSLVEIDLSQTTSHGGAGLEVGPTYLALYHGQFICGTFSKVWFGLTFNGGAARQYDPPGTNSSGWQRIWRITNTGRIAEAAEPDYAASLRDQAILAKLRSNGQTIDESAPLEAFLYRPTVPAMPKKTRDEYNEDACDQG